MAAPMCANCGRPLAGSRARINGSGKPVHRACSSNKATDRSPRRARMPDPPRSPTINPSYKKSAPPPSPSPRSPQRQGIPSAQPVPKRPKKPRRTGRLTRQATIDKQNEGTARRAETARQMLRQQRISEDQKLLEERKQTANAAEQGRAKQDTLSKEQRGSISREIRKKSQQPAYVPPAKRKKRKRYARDAGRLLPPENWPGPAYKKYGTTTRGRGQRARPDPWRGQL